MSSMSAPAVRTGRPATVSAAIGLILLLLAITIPSVIFTMDKFDAAFVAIATVFATIKLVGVLGLWNCRKWGFYVAFGGVAIDSLLSVGTVFESRGAASLLLMTFNVIVGIVVLVLLLRQSSRQAYV